VRNVIAALKARSIKFFKALINTIRQLPGRAFPAVLKLLSDIKSFLLVRIFWGRTNFYKQSLQAFVLIIAITLVLTGVSSRLSVVVEGNEELAGRSVQLNVGNIDSVQQGVGIQSVASANGNLNFTVVDYNPTNEDNLDSIATKFNVSKDTIKWANQSKIDYFSESFKSGEVLKIPQINGVLYEVQSGDSLDSVLNKTKGDKFQVIELNQLGPPNYDLPVGGIIFIPGGSLPAPTRPTVYQNPYYAVNPTVDVSALSGISFVNPMGCGYSVSRGFTGPYIYGLHDGVDFSGAYGCPIVAAAAGQVYFSGDAYGGQGTMVAIDHGSGVYTLYYHASAVYVSAGTYVQAGQVIAAVGCSGNCTGPHLHFSLRLGSNTFIDPRPYVPY
jgi:murein DD-endopeptidase MepM/ murein hydrolase activator NlpD